MYYITFFAILATIASIITVNYYTMYPLEVVEFFKVLYFFFSPLLAPLYVIYAMSIVYNKMNLKALVTKFFPILVPYIIYTLFVFSNYFHHLIFRISPEEGYVRESWVRVSYYIAFFYLAVLIIFTILHRKSAQAKVLSVICLNFILSTAVFSLQIFFPLVQLSGLSCISGLLVVHLYVLSVSKSMDSLTELNNRQSLTYQLIQLCGNSTPFSLAVFSLRNFKGINERFGLNVGDEILIDMANRLRDMLPANHLYRYNGDEFAYLELYPDSQQFNSQLKTVTDRMYEPFDVGKTSLKLDVIYARVDFPEFGLDAKAIVSAVDYSVSSVKKNLGETNFFYDPSICDHMKRRNHIIDRLKKAIDNDGFEIHYQAIYSTTHDNFPLAEALIRLKRSDEQPISPGEFIPIAEEIGLITRITYIVLEKVCGDLRSMLDRHGNALELKSISINFPYVSFLQRSTLEDVTEILQRYNIPPSMIKMELTERTLVSDTGTTRFIMDEFIKQGIEFELDDFGVEYSNLSLFFDIPIKIIKFDRSLVYSATADPDRRKFFEHIIHAVKSLDLKMVMEGVEEQELVDYLVGCGCDYIQGYVFTKPLQYNEFVDFLIKNTNKLSITN